MTDGGACAHGEESRAQALPFEEEEMMRSLTCWNTVCKYWHFSLSLQKNKKANDKKGWHFTEV